MLMDHPYVLTFAYYSVAVLALIVFLTVFELVTRYNGWEEIKKGNISVAMAIGGKIFGICNIFRFAIAANRETIYETIIWGVYGFVLLLVAYLIFEFLTPYFKIDKEIESDNRAVGFLSLSISVSLSYIIGSSIV